MFERRPGFFREDTLPGRRVEAKVKWFSAGKGFGFVTLSDGSQDAFLPMAVLRRAGYEDVPEGASITCEIGAGAKGPLVTTVLNVDRITATGPSGGGVEVLTAVSRAPAGPWRERSNGSRPERVTGSFLPMAAARTCSSTSPRCAAAEWRHSTRASGSGSRSSMVRRAWRPSASPFSEVSS